MTSDASERRNTIGFNRMEHRRDVWWVCSRHHRQLHAYGEEAMSVRSKK